MYIKHYAWTGCRNYATSEGYNNNPVYHTLMVRSPDAETMYLSSKSTTLTAALCPTRTLRKAMSEGVFMSHTAMVRSWGTVGSIINTCVQYRYEQNSSRHMRDKHVRETCSTLYLGAGHHCAGIESQVEHSLTVMYQSVYHLTWIHIPHSGGREVGAGGGGYKGGEMKGGKQGYKNTENIVILKYLYSSHTKQNQ